MSLTKNIEDKSSRRSETHPLFNPIILERIINFLSVQNLRNVRLVCKQWNRLASPYLQSRSKVILIRGKELDKRRYSYKNFISYLESLSPEDEIFFRNYHIEHWILNQKREKNLLTFWEKCGPLMKSLHLKDIIFYEVETIRNVFFNWTLNLERLFIEDCLFYKITKENIPQNCDYEYWNQEDFDEEYVFFDYYDHVSVEQLQAIEPDFSIMKNPFMKTLIFDQLDEEDFPLSWGEVFSAYPNLKCLRISASIPEKQLTLIMNSIVEMGVKNRLPLNELCFIKASSHKGPSRLNNFHLEQALKLNSSLQTIGVVLNSTIISTDELRKFLMSHSNTLTRLSLFHSDTELKMEDDIAKKNLWVLINDGVLKLRNLRSLNISPKLFMGSDQRLKDLKSLTHLHSINLWDSYFDNFNWENSIDEFLSLNSVEEISSITSLVNFSCGYLVYTTESLTNLSIYWPCIKKLKIPLNDEQIRIVFANLKSLEELSVYDRTLSDAGITGNPMQLTEFSEWNPQSNRQHPFIGDLKKLNKFVLMYWKYQKITDLSVYHGFLEVPNLTHLHLTRTEISVEALQELTFKPNLITLISPQMLKGDSY